MTLAICRNPTCGVYFQTGDATAAACSASCLGAMRVARVLERLDQRGALVALLRLCVRDDVTPEAVVGWSRLSELVRTRHELWGVAIDSLGLGYKEAERIFEVDHSTIISALRKREKATRRDPEIAERLRALEAKRAA